MPDRIRARYANGVLTPLDPVDLCEGVELAIAIDTAPPATPGPPDADKRRRQTPDDTWDDVPTDLAKKKRHDRFGAPKEEDEGGTEQPLVGLADLVAEAERLRRAMPDDAWDDFPTDFAMNKDHYLYGDPKETDE